MIERYQPDRGCKWTATLQTLSNPDKHRTLAAVYSQFEGASQVHRENALPVPDDRTQVRIPVTGQTAGVYFWNDAPVVDTLGELTLEVGRVLVEFQGEFGESDELIIDGEEASP
jgi:hypothetical protein